MKENEWQVIIIKTLDGPVATLILPDATEEEWSLASLPEGVQEGDRVGLLVDGGQWEMKIMPPPAGLKA